MAHIGEYRQEGWVQLYTCAVRLAMPGGAKLLLGLMVELAQLPGGRFVTLAFGLLVLGKFHYQNGVFRGQSDDGDQSGHGKPLAG